MIKISWMFYLALIVFSSPATGAFNNVFLWTLANEYETHPDGRHRLDKPGDVERARTPRAGSGITTRIITP